MTTVCAPFAANVSDACMYVQLWEGACEGGGFLTWTKWVVCEEVDSIRLLLIGAAILYGLFVLLLMGTATDDCLCTSITSIVDQLQISQNIAGVTLLAFGNGAVDIFGMLIEITATDTPKADLALGQLLGGSIFVTTVVIALIAFHRPFKVMRRPIVRDFVFFIISLLVLLTIMLYDDRMYMWQPLTIYAIYVLTVVGGSSVKAGKLLCFEWESRWAVVTSRSSIKRPSRGYAANTFAELTVSTLTMGATNKRAADEDEESKSSPPSGVGIRIVPSLCTVDCAVKTPHLATYTNHPTRRRNTLVRIGPDDPESAVHGYRDHGRFFVDEQDIEDSESQLQIKQLDESAANSPTMPIQPPSETSNSGSMLRCCAPCLGDTALAALDAEFRAASPIGKLFLGVKTPITILLRTTSPNSLAPWNKYLAILQCFASPLIVLFAFRLALIVPIVGGPPLFVYALIGSTLGAVLIAMLTRPQQEPVAYRVLVPYLGFLVAIAWVYALAAEIVNVVMMIGVMSRISHVVLGLTVLAWSNSCGDLIADLAVARQGFSRMAISAAVGGPLLNLLIGFGLSFLVAQLQGKTIEIPRGDISKLVLIGFLIASLVLSLIVLPLQRFYATRIYAYALIALYIAFLIVALAVEVY